MSILAHLHVAKSVIVVGGHDNVGVLNHTQVGLVSLLTVQHQLQEAAIHLVNSQDRPDALTQSLAQHSLGLDAHTLNAVHHHQGTVSNAQGSSHLRGEINVTGRVNQVDQVVIAFPLAAEALQLLLSALVVQRDTSGLDGNTTLLLILAGIGQAGITGLRNESIVS